MGSPEDPLEWILLDRYVHCTTKNEDEDEEEDVTASRVGFTCTGFPIRVSLRVADTPAVSRLYLHVPATWPDISEVRYPTVLAAHRGCILFCASVPFGDDSYSMAGYCPLDYFVYTAGAGASPPSLTRLPPCFIGGITADPEEDELYKPYSGRRQRLMSDRDVGILCHGGAFTVADLTFREGRTVELCFLQQPEDTQWSIKHLHLCAHPGISRKGLGDWNTDAVLPLHDRFLCWVDYYEGLLLMDVLNPGDKPHQFRFIPLPAPVRHVSRKIIDSITPDRSVCVTGNNNNNSTGFLKLVCITPTAGNAAFTITAWTLPNIHQNTWELDFKLEADEFWDCCGLLMHKIGGVRLSYPVVSLVHPGVISFVLMHKIGGDCPVYWILEVDMTKKVPRSALYIQEEEEEEAKEEVEGFSFRKSYRRVFRGEYFIPSQVTSYLRKNAIQSRLQSQSMQKAKMLTMMQKIQGMKQKETLVSSMQEKLSSTMKKTPVQSATKKMILMQKKQKGIMQKTPVCNTETTAQKREMEAQLIRTLAGFNIA